MFRNAELPRSAGISALAASASAGVSAPAASASAGVSAPAASVSAADSALVSSVAAGASGPDSTPAPIPVRTAIQTERSLPAATRATLRATAPTRAPVRFTTLIRAQTALRTGAALLLGAASLALLASGCGRAERPTNVLLIVLDTTRADILSPYGGRAQMPVLDRLASSGLVFESTTAHAPFTLGSVATVLTSLGPDLHGIKGHAGFALSPAAVTMAEALGEAGFISAAFLSAVPLRAETGIDQGFDHFDDDLSGTYAVFQPQFRPVQEGLRGVQRRGLETTQRAVAWLQQDWPRDRPFFLVVHLYDPHEPYDPVPSFLQEYPSDPYAAEVASTDPMIGELLSTIEALGVSGDTVVSVVADHGEAFLEHDEVGHGAFLYETTMHVPWILSGPRIPHGRVRGLARLIDVAPTLFGACGVEPPTAFEGVDLLAEITQSAARVSPLRTNTGATPAGTTDTGGPYFDLAARSAYLETYYMRFAHRWSEEIGWRDGDWKFVKAPRSELYDLQTDPAESRNLLASEPEQAEAMERALLVHLSRPSPYRLDAHTSAPDAATTEQLASLGYTSSPSAEGLHLEPGWEIGLPDPKDAVQGWNRGQQAQAALRIALSSLSMQDFGATLEWADRALDLDPEKYEALVPKGQALASLGRIPEAIEIYETALQHLPEEANLWQAYGVAQDQTGQARGARRAYERALAIDPKHGRANLFLGLQLVREGRMQEALPYYQLAVLADPKNVPTLMELARVFFQLGQLPNSRRVLEQVLTVDEESPEGLLMLGQICQKMGDVKSTKAVLEAFVRIHPAHPETPRIRGILERM